MGSTSGVGNPEVSRRQDQFTRLSKDLRKQARVNGAMDWLQTGFYREYGYHLIYPAAARSQAPIGRGESPGGMGPRRDFGDVLDDHWLGAGNRYLCGDAITSPTISVPGWRQSAS
jgi:hypothetical protein